MRYTDLTVNEIRNSIIIAAEKTEGIILSELRDEFAAGENNRDDYIQQFDNAIRKLGVFCAVAGADTEVAAKATAYDRVLAVADKFVRSFTQGTGCIPNEAELTKHLEESQKALASFKRIQVDAQNMRLNTEQYALLLSDQVAQLSQALQQKNTELAQLQQQLQQKDQKIAELAAQVPVPTP